MIYARTTASYGWLPTLEVGVTFLVKTCWIYFALLYRGISAERGRGALSTERVHLGTHNLDASGMKGEETTSGKYERYPTVDEGERQMDPAHRYPCRETLIQELDVLWMGRLDEGRSQGARQCPKVARKRRRQTWYLSCLLQSQVHKVASAQLGLSIFHTWDRSRYASSAFL